MQLACCGFGTCGKLNNISLYIYCLNLVLFFSSLAESLQVAVKASKMSDVSQSSEEGPGGAVLMDTPSTQGEPASQTACKWQYRPSPRVCAHSAQSLPPRGTQWSHKTKAVAPWFQGNLMYIFVIRKTKLETNHAGHKWIFYVTINGTCLSRTKTYIGRLHCAVLRLSIASPPSPTLPRVSWRLGWIFERTSKPFFFFKGSLQSIKGTSFWMYNLLGINLGMNHNSES